MKTVSDITILIHQRRETRSKLSYWIDQMERAKELIDKYNLELARINSEIKAITPEIAE